MTASTEQERAEFEAVASDDGKWLKAIERDAKGNYILMQTARGWMWWQQAWQASRRAQLAPKFSHVAKQKLDYSLEAGEEITGYAIQNKYGRRGAIDCHGFVYWWQDAAPVQMPEPVAYLYHDAPSLEDYIANERAGIPLNSSCISVSRMPHCRNETPLYTEQQVRELLEQKAARTDQSTQQEDT